MPKRQKNWHDWFAAYSDNTTAGSGKVDVLYIWVYDVTSTTSAITYGATITTPEASELGYTIEDASGATVKTETNAATSNSENLAAGTYTVHFTDKAGSKLYADRDVTLKVTEDGANTAAYGTADYITITAPNLGTVTVTGADGKTSLTSTADFSSGVAVYAPIDQKYTVTYTNDGYESYTHETATLTSSHATENITGAYTTVDVGDVEKITVGTNTITATIKSGSTKAATSVDGTATITGAAADTVYLLKGATNYDVSVSNSDYTLYDNATGKALEASYTGGSTPTNYVAIDMTTLVLTKYAQYTIKATPSFLSGTTVATGASGLSNKFTFDFKVFDGTNDAQVFAVYGYKFATTGGGAYAAFDSTQDTYFVSAAGDGSGIKTNPANAGAIGSYTGANGAYYATFTIYDADGNVIDSVTSATTGLGTLAAR